MKELRHKLANMVRSNQKYNFKTYKKCAENACGFKVNNEVILDSFLDILISELKNYNFKKTPSKSNYVFKIFKVLNKYASYMEDDSFKEKIEALEKITDSKSLRAYSLAKGLHREETINFFTRIKNEISLLKVQLNIEDEKVFGLATKKEDLEQFLKYLLFDIRNFNYIEILFSQKPDLMNYKNNGKYLLDLILTKYIESLMDLNDNNIVYYEKVVNLFIESPNFKISPEYKKSLIKRLEIFLNTIDISNEKSRIKKKAHLFIESTINRLNNIEPDYSEEEIQKLNDKYGIIIKDDFTIPKAPFKDITCTDMTDRRVITIDGDNTMCFDDAISFDVLPDGTYRVGIYISDVADFIRRPSALDYLAYKQGNSIYLPYNVIPMFPTNLANNVCSLREKEYKNVVAYTFIFSSDFELISDDVRRAIIKVNKNYGTTLVDRILERKDSIEEYELLKKVIAFSEYLQAKNKHVEDYHTLKELTKGTMEKYDYSIGYSALSQYMVFINNFIAERFAKSNGLPFIYRINGSTYNSKQLEFLKAKVELNPELEGIMTQIQGMYVPSLYSTTNLEHKGLGLSSYAHTTNPIRNYASLANQRFILEFLVDKDFSRVEEYSEMLPSMVDDLNGAKDRIEEYKKEYSKIYFKKHD